MYKISSAFALTRRSIIHTRRYYVRCNVLTHIRRGGQVQYASCGGWKSSQMPAHYAKAEFAERGAIARFKDGKQ